MAWHLYLRFSLFLLVLEVMRDNSKYRIDLYEAWNDADNRSNQLPETEIRRVENSQRELIASSRTKRIPYAKVHDSIGIFPETLEWLEIAWAALDINRDALELRAELLIDAAQEVRSPAPSSISARRGETRRAEIMFWLAYLASFFTEGSSPKLLSVARSTPSWTQREPAWKFSTLLTYQGPTVQTSVHAPTYLVDQLTVIRKNWIASVEDFAEQFTPICHELIVAST